MIAPARHDGLPPGPRVIDGSRSSCSPPAARADLGPLSPGGRFVRRLRAADAVLAEEIERRRRAPDLEERTDVLALLLRARDEDGEAMTTAELSRRGPCAGRDGRGAAGGGCGC